MASRLGGEETRLVRRWAAEPNGFIICSYWLVECLALAGELDQATRIFEQVTGLANSLGPWRKRRTWPPASCRATSPRPFRMWV